MAMEEIDIVIVGGGICGLATSLALHRKGIKSVVLERSDTLRATGCGITIFTNGWCALRQLGVAFTLQSISTPLQRVIDVSAVKGTVRESPMSSGEVRCIRRIDLIKTLANALPLDTIRFGAQVVSVNVEKSSSYALVQLLDGSSIKAKVLIGCDGANSVIGNHLGLKPTCLFSACTARGITTYTNGHGFAPDFFRVAKDGVYVGRIPIDENSLHWLVGIRCTQRDFEKQRDPSSIRQMILNKTTGFPTDIIEMLEKADLNSWTLNQQRYRAPWNLLPVTFRKQNITLAGDAWHVMAPYLGQGGSVALEDAIVLARCLSKKIYKGDFKGRRMELTVHQGMEALDEYLKERRNRVFRMSTLTYLTGTLIVEKPSFLLKYLCTIIIGFLFRDPLDHTRYDCGEL